MATESTEITRPLKILVPLIKEELDAGDSAGIEHYRKAGEMLIEAKEQMPHGEFTAWSQRTFNRDRRQISAYMKLVEAVKREPRRTFESLREATRPNAPSSRGVPAGPAWAGQVREVVSRVDTEALAREAKNRAGETRLVQALAKQLIDIGYKVLSAKLHPDKPGGSSEAMARLNKVRAMLREAI